MYFFRLRLSILFLPGISWGKSNGVVDAFLPRNHIGVGAHKTQGFSRSNGNDLTPIALLSNRGGGNGRAPRVRTLLSSPVKEDEVDDATSSFRWNYGKSKEQQTFLESVLETNFIFHDVSNLSEAAAAFEEVDFAKGSSLCKQGDLDDTDYLYIIYKGDCGVFINGKQLGEPYGTMGKGSIVGDLAMIFDRPRAATIEAIAPVKAFRLHRDAFEYFLTKKASSSSSNGKSPKEKIQRQVKKIDTALDQIIGLDTKYEGEIIPQFYPLRRWLWTRWKGTILQHAWKSSCLNMALSVVFISSFRYYCNEYTNHPITWAIGRLPDKGHTYVSRILGLSKLWNTLLGLVTFVVTFFLNQSYTLWKDIYLKSCQIRGNFNEINLMASARAERDPNTNSYTPKAAKALEDISHHCRLVNVLSWAALAPKFKALMTTTGLSRMLSRGLMTKKEFKLLSKASGPHETALQWLFVRLMNGLEEGAFPNTTTVERVFTENVLGLRLNTATIRNKLLGKIPLAYAHFVQFLVDFFLVLAPFALYPELGFWSIPAVGLLNLFYGGLVDLSKILLFPLENDENTFYSNTSVNVDVGVVIREGNGATRWKNGLQTLPF